jgi:carbonic anhydrase
VYTIRRTGKDQIACFFADLPGTSTLLTEMCESIRFHTPSEHELDGDSFDLEMHYICYGITTGTYAIFSWLFEKGSSNELFTSIFVNKEIPGYAEALTDFYSYEGSWT